MKAKVFVAALAVLTGFYGVSAQPASLLTRENSTLIFPLTSLTTNGVPGLTNLPSKLMVSLMPAHSTSGGTVSVVNTQAWVRYYNAGYGSFFNVANQAAADDAGDLVIAGNSYKSQTDYGWATIKYAGDGTAVWTNRYDGSLGDTANNFAYYLAMNGRGDVVVAGTSQNTNTLTDAVTIRYSAGGTAVVTNRYHTSTNNDQPTGLALDAAGNAYVIFTSYPPAGSLQGGYVTVKYDSSGNALWTNFYQNLSNGSDSAAGIAVDGNGNVFVTGSSAGVGGTSIATLKYSPDGTALWTNRYFGAAGALGRTITVDRAGHVLVAGESAETPASYPIIAYSNDGTPLWTNVLAGPDYSGGSVPQLATDPLGNVFVAGGAPGTSSAGVYDILKLSSTGVPRWTNLNVIFGVTNASLTAAAVDHAGNLFLTGYSGGTNSDFVTMKFAGADGSSVWTNRYGGPTGGDAAALAMAVDNAGNVFVTGQSAPAIGSLDFATVKYADEVVYTPPTNFTGTDSITFVAVDDAGNSATGLVQIVVSPSALQFNTGALRLDSQGLHLQVDGARDTNAVVLYASTNLLNWFPIATNSPVLGSADFLDPAVAHFRNRFYRATQNVP